MKPAFQLIIVDEAHALRNRDTKSYQLGELLSDWADYLIFLSATPLNLRSEDLFNLVNLLSEADFADFSIFGLQLEPNAALNEISRMLGKGDRYDQIARWSSCHRSRGWRLGAIVTSRPGYQQLRGLLEADALSPEEKSRARRQIAEFNTLSGLLTRTRKADVPDKKALREVQEVGVIGPNARGCSTTQCVNGASGGLESQGVPPGFALQMPMRQAASSIPAMQEWLRDKTGKKLEGVDDWDTDVCSTPESGKN